MNQSWRVTTNSSSKTPRPPLIGLGQELANYPNLQTVLDRRWVARHNPVPPERDQHRIARWLRSDTAPGILTTLDRVIGNIQNSNIPDASAHLDSFAWDADGTADILTELFFGNWLINNGYKNKLQLPRAGADFLIDLGGKEPYAIEAISPRKIDYRGELLDQLKWLATTYGYWVRIRFDGPRTPILDFKDRTDLVDRAEAALERAVARNPSHPNFTQRFRSLGLSLSWRLRTPPGASSMALGGVDRWYAMQILASAAQTKERQLKPGTSNALLVGAISLPIDFRILLEEYRTGTDEQIAQLNQEFGPIWQTVPDRVKHICVYELSLDRDDPFRTTWVTNPLSPYTDPPQFEDFRTAFTYH